MASYHSTIQWCSKLAVGDTEARDIQPGQDTPSGRQGYHSSKWTRDSQDGLIPSGVFNRRYISIQRALLAGPFAQEQRLSFHSIALFAFASLTILRNSTPENEFAESETLIDLLEHCGSFLTWQGDTTFFVHQSAKDCLQPP